MTDNRARKKAVRRRMEQTGEKYTEARRALEGVPQHTRRGQFGRFTEGARRVIVLARDEARALEHACVGTEHILLGLLRNEDGAIAARVLKALGITAGRVHATVARGTAPAGAGAAAGQLPFTPGAKQALEFALREALSLRHNYIGTEHILLGLVRDQEAVAARILFELDAGAERIRGEVIRSLAGPGGAAGSAAELGSTFERLTEHARTVIDCARREARALGHHRIGGEHILLGLLSEREGLAARTLEALGVTLDPARARVLERVPGGEPALTGRRPLTPRAKRMYERAGREALARGNNHIDTGDILLGLLREPKSTAHAVLRDLGADPGEVRDELLNRLAEAG